MYHELTTPRLLVMDYIDGIQIDHIEELKSLGYDMTEIGEKTAENYCKQILEDGFFHADPHPGNLWISKGQIAWLDLGMAGHLSSNTKLLLRKAITALLENDIYSLKNVLLAFAEPQERVNHARLYTDIDDIVSKYVSMDFGTMRLGDLIERLLAAGQGSPACNYPGCHTACAKHDHDRRNFKCMCSGCKSVADFICTYVQSADP